LVIGKVLSITVIVAIVLSLIFTSMGWGLLTTLLGGLAPDLTSFINMLDMYTSRIPVLNVVFYSPGIMGVSIVASLASIPIYILVISIFRLILSIKVLVRGY
jgi:hypothetical protein